MPEGHSLYRLARRFTEAFQGRTVGVSSPQGRFSAGAALINGRVVQGAFNHGKHLFLDFGDRFVHIHLGLYGKPKFTGNSEFFQRVSIGGVDNYVAPVREEYLVPDAPQGAIRIRVETADGWMDIRGPNRCEVVSPAEVESVIARLGPDPLQHRAGDVQKFAERLARTTPVGLLLMDQSVVAGIGNIYRAEVLFLTRTDPATPGKELDQARIQEIWEHTVEQLRFGADEGRIVTIRDEHVRQRIRADHYVYQRQGNPCVRCGTDVLMREAQARKLYWCPGCQTST